MFLLYSQDYLLLKKNKDILIKKINKEKQYFVEEYDFLLTNIGDIISSSLNYSFFSNKKIIIINNCLFLVNNKYQKKIDLNVFLNFLKNYNDQLKIILTVNEENINYKLEICREILKICTLNKKISPLTNQVKKRYITHTFKKHNLDIDNEIIYYLTQSLPNSLVSIDNEINKLISFNQPITFELVKNNISDYSNKTIFTLCEYLLAKQYDNFLSSYYYFKNKDLNFYNFSLLIINNFVFLRTCILKNRYPYVPWIINDYRYSMFEKYFNNFSVKIINNILLFLYKNIENMIENSNYNYILFEIFMIKLIRKCEGQIERK